MQIASLIFHGTVRFAELVSPPVPSLFSAPQLLSPPHTHRLHIHMASPSPEPVSPAHADAEIDALERKQQSANDPLLDARQAASEHTTAVYKLVLTGGPCAGKTTALSRMGDFFREKG